MSSYLQTDLLNKQFKIELIRKISLSKILSSVDKHRFKEMINREDFSNTLRNEFGKSAYTSNDIDRVIDFLQGVN